MSEPTATVFEAAPGPLSEQLEVVRAAAERRERMQALLLANVHASQLELQAQAARREVNRLAAELRALDQIEVAA